MKLHQDHCPTRVSKISKLGCWNQGAKKFQIHLLEELTIGLKSILWRNLTLNFTDINLFKSINKLLINLIYKKLNLN